MAKKFQKGTGVLLGQSCGFSTWLRELRHLLPARTGRPHRFANAGLGKLRHNSTFWLLNDVQRDVETRALDFKLFCDIGSCNVVHQFGDILLHFLRNQIVVFYAEVRTILYCNQRATYLYRNREECHACQSP